MCRSLLAVLLHCFYNRLNFSEAFIGFVCKKVVGNFVIGLFGVMYFFAVKLGVQSFDKRCESVIDGFKWQQNDEVLTECVPSADGNKLLIYSRGPTTYYESIGVLDFANKTYVKFSRENLGSVNEHRAFWFDNNSVAIATSGDGDTRQYYIYRLLDQ